MRTKLTTTAKEKRTESGMKTKKNKYLMAVQWTFANIDSEILRAIAFQ